MKNNPESSSDAKFTALVVYGLVVLWFLFALQMGWQGRYATGFHKPPLAFGLSAAIPVVFFVFAYARRGRIWAFCQTLDLRILVAVHLWRIMAIDFLLCGAEGRLPLGFALPAGMGDILTGLLAVSLAFGISSGAVARKRFVAWNLFGLFDLVLALSLGLSYSASSLGFLAGTGPTTLLMTELPRSMIPTFGVPMFILLHVLTLARRKELLAVPATEPERFS